jgi:hypothetical protein
MGFLRIGILFTISLRENQRAVVNEFKLRLLPFLKLGCNEWVLNGV